MSKYKQSSVVPVEPIGTVEVQYRFINDYHVFTSEDVYGLYVASKDPQTAFGNVQGSIEKLIKFNDGLDIKAMPADPYREYLIAVTSNTPIPNPAIINASRTFLVKRAA